MYMNHLLSVILFLVVLYFFFSLIYYITIEQFETFQNLSPPITENSCIPPQQKDNYSFQINRDFCTNNLTCYKKGDICVNQHCIPQGVPPPASLLQDCNGCSPPGLI